MGVFGIGPEDVVPGMWVMLALLISVAATPILNMFLESWRIDSLEVVLMTVLASHLSGSSSDTCLDTSIRSTSICFGSTRCS